MTLEDWVLVEQMNKEKRHSTALCKALDWCRANRAVVYFFPDKITVNTQYGPYSGITIEEAVEASRNEQERQRKETENAPR